jgi:alkaline phosphatase
MRIISRLVVCSVIALSYVMSYAKVSGEESLRLLLPERTRLLEDQRVDLVVELRNVAQPEKFKITANGSDITAAFSGPARADLDCDNTVDSVYRADLYSFKNAGTVHLTASVEISGRTVRDERDIEIRPFQISGRPRNIVLFIGDAMGASYRDAARLVSRSVENSSGVPGLREGFFDSLLEMDRMPVSGMVMTYASDRVVPDSANTASAWSTGNKTVEGALSVLADGTDCAWRKVLNEDTQRFALDNPRIETLWEYLKRRFDYRTGIVTTAFITDATPAAEGTHTATRQTTFEIGRQYLENPLRNNQPLFDVILGGGREDFDPDIRADGRDLISEFSSRGYTVVSTRTELRNLSSNANKVLGLFRRPNSVAREPGAVHATANGNMDSAYDRLHLTRPGSEPVADIGKWTDQPFLDEMTAKALSILGSHPFILLVEGGLIDKQSHLNHAAGVIWDTIELDRAVGVGRAWANSRTAPDTLVLVSADHDQSMSILGVREIPDADLTDRKQLGDSAVNLRAEHQYGGAKTSAGFPDYQDRDGDGYPDNRESDGKGMRRLVVAFRTDDHVGTSVPITAEGPGAWLFTGYMDQTDITFKIAVTLSGDTATGDDLVKEILLNQRYPKTFGR